MRAHVTGVPDSVRNTVAFLLRRCGGLDSRAGMRVLPRGAPVHAMQPHRLPCAPPPRAVHGAICTKQLCCAALGAWPLGAGGNSPPPTPRITWLRLLASCGLPSPTPGFAPGHFHWLQAREKACRDLDNCNFIVHYMDKFLERPDTDKLLSTPLGKSLSPPTACADPR